MSPRDVSVIRSNLTAQMPTPPPDAAVDVQRTDTLGEIDLGQLEYNLSLTPRERIEQNDAWVEFIHIARRAGQKLHGETKTA